MTRSQSVAVHAVLIAGALVMCFPFLWMLLTSLKHSSEVLDSSQWVPSPRSFVATKTEFGSTKEWEVEELEKKDGQVTVRFLYGPMRGETSTVPDADVIRKRWHVDNYRTAWDKGGEAGHATFGRYFYNSFLVAALTTVGTVVTSVLAAFALAFFRFQGKTVIFIIMLMTMMVPQQVLLIPDYLLIHHLGWLDTYPALIVPWCAGVFGIFLLRQFFLTFPRDLYEAAILDGCSRLDFLFRIMIPLSLPPILTISIFSFLASWNSLIWPLVVATQDKYYTIQVGLATFATEAGTRWELLMAASAISIIPLVILYFMAQRYFIEGIAQSGIKG